LNTPSSGGSGTNTETPVFPTTRSYNQPEATRNGEVESSSRTWECRGMARSSLIRLHM